MCFIQPTVYCLCRLTSAIDKFSNKQGRLQCWQNYHRSHWTDSRLQHSFDYPWLSHPTRIISYRPGVALYRRQTYEYSGISLKTSKTGWNSKFKSWNPCLPKFKFAVFVDFESIFQQQAGCKSKQYLQRHYVIWSMACEALRVMRNTHRLSDWQKSSQLRSACSAVP